MRRLLGDSYGADDSHSACQLAQRSLTMAGLGAKDILRNVTALEQLIEEINFQRAKEMRQCLMSKDSGMANSRQQRSQQLSWEFIGVKAERMG